MKQILILFCVISLSSCNLFQSKGKTKNDTCAVAYRAIGDKSMNWQLATISFTISRSQDTFNWKTYQPTDTLRDAQNKPIFDTLTHRPRYQYGWAEVPDSVIHKTSIVFLPK